MYSKLIPKEVLEESCNMSNFAYRMSGDTFGSAIRIIGNLMKIDTNYHVDLNGIEDTKQMDTHVFNMAQDVVRSLGLKHFKFKKKDLTIHYDVWYDKSEID